MNRVIPDFEPMDEETVKKLRSMTITEKFQLIGELNCQARERAAARLQHQFPEWSAEQIQAEVARRMLNGDEEIFK